MNANNRRSMSASDATVECLQCGAEIPDADRVRLGLTYWCERCERHGPDDERGED
jgi:hypothetical protein